MRFYKVKHDTRTGLVKDELLTEKELMKVYGQKSLETIGAVYPVEVSKFRTYWNFGCRFEMKGEENG